MRYDCLQTREGNKVADKMEQMAMQQEDFFVSFCFPPDYVIDILQGNIPCAEDFLACN